MPKILVNPDGIARARATRVSVGKIEEKMGIHGNATCVMNYDGATGDAARRPRTAASRAMFTMMNEARAQVGMQGLAQAAGAYQLAAAYARERLQGRAIGGAENPSGPADPIIVHPDVRRALLDQKAFVEGGRAFALWAATLIDADARAGDDGARDGLVSLLTPVVKGFLTDKGFECTVQAQQVFGGHGYIEETGVSQFVRDARIAMIYEGANGVQALDLVGRKLGLDGGKPIMAFFGLVRETLKAHEADDRLKARFPRPAEGRIEGSPDGGGVLPAQPEDPGRGAGRLHRLPPPLRPRLPRPDVGAHGRRRDPRHRRLPPREARHGALLHVPLPPGDRASPRPHPLRSRSGHGAAGRGLLMSPRRAGDQRTLQLCGYGLYDRVSDRRDVDRTPGCSASKAERTVKENIGRAL